MGSQLLMDEPLSNLDAVLRSGLRAEIVGLARSLGLTVLYVTHDQIEAQRGRRRQPSAVDSRAAIARTAGVS